MSQSKRKTRGLGLWKHRVWIELERPADATEGHARAKLASRMLVRLGLSRPDTIWWNERAERYCVTTDEAGTFLECVDNGHWFNLDHFGRD
jgi:hypothetical protein